MSISDVKEQQVAGERASTDAPQIVSLELLSQPPQFTAELQANRERMLTMVNLPPEREAMPTVSTPPEPGTETQAYDISPAVREPEIPPAATFQILVSTPLAPTTGKSTINEPSVAQSSSHVFFTGNWYAARSDNGGLTWSYINPYADMSDFCCDQDIIYVPSRNIFLWYRQGVFNSSTGQNRFRLGVSNDAISWAFYDFQPINVNNTWTNQQFDYPHLALSNNFLYISTNINNASNAFIRKVIMRFPLDALRDRTGFNYWYWTQVSGWGNLAHGATDTMYIGDHAGNTSSFRVYRQPENSTSIFWIDRNIPGWTFLNRDGSCPSPDGQNWCARADSRIQAGWVANGTVGFMWNAKQGGNFPFPYVEAATFRQSDLTYTGRPLVWNSSGAWQYPFASPNARGDIGLTAYFGGGSNYPSTQFLIDDSANGTPPPWEAHFLRGGTNGASAWGDYVRNRPSSSPQFGWASSGQTQQGGTSGSNTEPRFFIVSR
jgi:hypothetical protein